MVFQWKNGNALEVGVLSTIKVSKKWRNHEES